MQRLAYISGAILGLLAVITGAMGAHALKDVLSSAQLDSFETAVRFQMYHALLLLLLGMLAARSSSPRLISYAIYAVIAGVLLFSGSIYVLVLTPLKVGLITPLGGLVLIAGWACLLIWALREGDKN